jgi:deoxyribose-phosphate aldolase
MFSKTALAKMIDHSLLRPEATAEEIIRFCEEAKDYHFACVVVLPSWCQLARRRLRDSDVNLCTVVAFPYGTLSSACKAFEARQAILNGATELDMVINIGAVRSGDFAVVQGEIEEVVTTAKLAGLSQENDEILAKVILEVGLLSREQQAKVCRIAAEARADFVKTCTGQGPRGVTVQDVKFIRQIIGREMGLKASGGVRTLEQAMALVNAGANRIGTSTGIEIVEAYDQSQGALTEEVLQ